VAAGIQPDVATASDSCKNVSPILVCIVRVVAARVSVVPLLFDPIKKGGHERRIDRTKLRELPPLHVAAAQARPWPLST
jgi:hypothetical protein